MSTIKIAASKTIIKTGAPIVYNNYTDQLFIKSPNYDHVNIYNHKFPKNQARLKPRVRLATTPMASRKLSFAVDTCTQYLSKPSSN